MLALRLRPEGFGASATKYHDADPGTGIAQNS